MRLFPRIDRSCYACVRRRDTLEGIAAACATPSGRLALRQVHINFVQPYTRIDDNPTNFWAVLDY